MLISIFTNPWVWVLIEVIFTIALYSYSHLALQEAHGLHEVVSAKENVQLVILFGAVAVMSTSIYAIFRKR